MFEPGDCCPEAAGRRGIHQVPGYRLIAGHATVVEAFEAADDAEAIDFARKFAQEFPAATAPDLRERGGFRLEIQDGHGWELFFAWMP
jgi:hypothetical protein